MVAKGEEGLDYSRVADDVWSALQREAQLEPGDEAEGMWEGRVRGKDAAAEDDVSGVEGDLVRDGAVPLANEFVVDGAVCAEECGCTGLTVVAEGGGRAGERESTPEDEGVVDRYTGDQMAVDVETDLRGEMKEGDHLVASVSMVGTCSFWRKE